MDLIEFYIGFLRDRAKDYADFLRQAAGFLSPKPDSLEPPYTLPFTGGQMAGVRYNVALDFRYKRADGTFTNWNYNSQPIYNYLGKITGIRATNQGDSQNYANLGVIIFSGNTVAGYVSTIGGYPQGWTVEFSNVRVDRTDGLPDTGGNLPNPNPSPPIKDDGLFKTKNEPISEQAIVLAPALPLVLVSAIIAGYLNAIAAAKAALDALAAIKKVAEALESLQELWEKLREFLNEWDKNRKQKKEIVRQNYGGIQGDGTISFYKEGNTKYTAIQLDIVLTSIPNNIGKYFAEYSPNRYPYGGLGYIAFYSINQGILSTHQIEFKRTSYEVPKLAVGFIYHLGLNEQVRGFAFAEFSKLL